MKKLLTLAFAFVFAASVYAAEFPAITIGDLKASMATSQKIVLLDANGTDSWQAGHIPGAIDFAANQDHLASVLAQGQERLDRGLLRQSAMPGLSRRGRRRQEARLQEYQAPLGGHHGLEGRRREN